MAVQTIISFFNYFRLNTVSAVAQTGWPANNARFPQQPFVPWKTPDTAVTNLVLDLGTAQPIQLLMAVDVNYATAVLFLDDDPAFGSPYSSGVLPIGRNPWNTRSTLVHLLASPFIARYLMYQIPAQSTTDGLTYFRTGGLWAGQCLPLPSDIRWDERPRRVEPHIDVPLIGGGTPRVSTGRPYVEMRAQRLALTFIDTPATGDELGSWLEYDRWMSPVGGTSGYDGTFAWYFNRGNTAEGFIFRKMNESNWNVNQVVSEDELILHEVVGP